MKPGYVFSAVVAVALVVLIMMVGVGSVPVGETDTYNEILVINETETEITEPGDIGVEVNEISSSNEAELTLYDLGEDDNATKTVYEGVNTSVELERVIVYLNDIEVDNGEKQVSLTVEYERPLEYTGLNDVLVVVWLGFVLFSFGLVLMKVWD